MEKWITAKICYDSGISEKQRGLQVTENLVLIRDTKDSWNIHHVRSGRQIIRASFTYQAAKSLAEFLDTRYADYQDGNLFELLSEFPQYPILQLAQYSVQDGVEIWDRVQRMESIDRIFDERDVRAILP